MADIRTFFANAYETTLTSELGPTGLSFEVATLGGAPSMPAYLVVDPDTPASREYILVSTTITGGFEVAGIGDRYLEGSGVSSGLTHAAGTVVKQAPVAQMFRDLHDRVEGRLSDSAHTASLHNSLGISHSSLTGLTSGDPHTQYLNVAKHDTTARHGSNVVDHGSVGGLGDDDHTQYVLVSGTRAFTAPPTAPNLRMTAVSVAGGGTVTLDMSGPALVTLEATTSSSTTFATSNRAAGRAVSARVLPSSSGRALTFPSTWRFVGEKPESIDAGVTGMLSLIAYGTGDADIVAGWAESK